MRVPHAIDVAISRQAWRDPGMVAWKQILNGIEIPPLTLFATPDRMQRTWDMVATGGFVEDPQFCMVRREVDLASADDPRLVLARTLFVGGSTIPGDDVLVAVEDVAAEPGRVVVFDWARPIPTRWAPVMTVEEFCDAIAAYGSHISA